MQLDNIQVKWKMVGQWKRTWLPNTAGLVAEEFWRSQSLQTQSASFPCTIHNNNYYCDNCAMIIIIIIGLVSSIKQLFQRPVSILLMCVQTFKILSPDFCYKTYNYFHFFVECWSAVLNAKGLPFLYNVRTCNYMGRAHARS